MFYVYLIQNIIDDSVYIGKTTNVGRRWAEHRTIANGTKEKYGKKYNYIHAAISKYGEHNFSITTLAGFDNESNAFEAEIESINQYRLDGYKLYNLTNGGEGASGHKMSEQARSKISAYQKSKPPMSQNTKDKISAARTGKTRSETTKLNISQSIAGERNPRAKLTWSDVCEIRRFYSEGIPYLVLSQRFGVSANTVGAICRFEIWKNKSVTG